jgi:hypothetical protein
MGAQCPQGAPIRIKHKRNRIGAQAVAAIADQEAKRVFDNQRVLNL